MREVHNQIRTYQAIKDILPRLTALAMYFESDVLSASVIILERELNAIQAQWAGQAVPEAIAIDSMTTDAFANLRGRIVRGI